MKFYQKRGFALAVLIAAVVLASAYGLSRKPAALIEVSYHHWIADSAELLSTDTEAIVEKYNDTWDGKYSAVVAVATVDSAKGRTLSAYAQELGEKWGLGANDICLVIDRDTNDYYAKFGESFSSKTTDTQQQQLKTAIEKTFYDGDFDTAVTAFYRAADVVYSQAYAGGQSTYGN
jgi:uncharacterized membrane protein YgcG